jgi:hypothetical protein
MDFFTEPRVIGKDIDSDYDQLKLTLGYDHNFLIEGWKEDEYKLRLAAKVRET